MDGNDDNNDDIDFNDNTMDLLHEYEMEARLEELNIERGQRQHLEELLILERQEKERLKKNSEQLEELILQHPESLGTLLHLERGKSRELEIQLNQEREEKENMKKNSDELQETHKEEKEMMQKQIEELQLQLAQANKPNKRIRKTKAVILGENEELEARIKFLEEEKERLRNLAETTKDSLVDAHAVVYTQQQQLNAVQTTRMSEIQTELNKTSDLSTRISEMDAQLQQQREQIHQLQHLVLPRDGQI